jgi:hypothetical protein
MFPETGEDLADCVGAAFEMGRRKPFVRTAHVRFPFHAEAGADDGDPVQAEVLEQGE